MGTIVHIRQSNKYHASVSYTHHLQDDYHYKKNHQLDTNVQTIVTKFCIVRKIQDRCIASIKSVVYRYLKPSLQDI